MTTEEILKDIDVLTEEYTNLYNKKWYQSKEYAAELNKRYSKYIGAKLEWHSSECYNSDPIGYFGGFCTATIGTCLSVIPLIYQAKKDGTQSTRRFTTFEKQLRQVIKLLEEND